MMPLGDWEDLAAKAAELEALSDVIMHAESDREHWPFPVRRLSPYELARAIWMAGYRKTADAPADTWDGETHRGNL